MSHDPRALLTEMLQAAATSTERGVPRHLPPPKERTIVIGADKASAAMVCPVGGSGALKRPIRWTGRAAGAGWIRGIDEGEITPLR